MKVGAILICLAATLWGLDNVLLTPKLSALDTGFAVFMFHAIPFLMMNLFLFRQYKFLFIFNKKEYLTLCLIAIFGGAVGTLAMTESLFIMEKDSLPKSAVLLLNKLQPVFAIILASLLLKEKITKKFLIWAIIAIIAAFFLTAFAADFDFQTGKNTIYAALFMLLAAFSFGSATVFGKKILHKYDFITVTFYRFGLTSIVMLVYVLCNGSVSDVQKITKSQWLIFVIIAFTTGAGAIFLYYYGLKKVKAIVSTICELCYPISFLIFGYFLKGHSLTFEQAICALILLVAITKIVVNQSFLNNSGIQNGLKSSGI